MGILTKLLRSGGKAETAEDVVSATSKGSRLGRAGKAGLGLGTLGVLGYMFGSSGGGGDEEGDTGEGNVSRAGAGGAGMGPGGLAGGAARAGMSGGGSLPSVRGASRASVSPTMTTNKLLVVAINYLASIDQTLKNQLDTDRSIFTQQMQTAKETGLESSGVVPQDGAGGFGMPRWAKNLGSGLLQLLKDSLIMAGLMGLPFIVEKLKEGYQYVSDGLSEMYDWTARQLESMSNVVSDTVSEIGEVWNWLTGSGEAENDGTIAPQETASGIGGGDIRDEIATAGMMTTTQISALESMGFERGDDQTFRARGDGAALTVDQVEKALRRKFNTSGDATDSFANQMSKNNITQFLRNLPGAGFLISLGLATLRLKDGDFVGAGLELIAGLTPFGNVLTDFLRQQGIISGDILGGDGKLSPQNRINAMGDPSPITEQREASKHISERVLGENRNLNDTYGSRSPRRTGPHGGYDLRGRTGDPLYAYDDGEVTSAGNSGGDSGNLVKIKLDNGYEVGYSHMDTISVRQGQRVKRGDPIGTVGNTGNSTGSHLHFSVKDSQGRTVDPSVLVGAQRSDRQAETALSREEAIRRAAQIPGYNVSSREAQERAIQAIQESGRTPSSMAIPSPTADTSGQIAGYAELFTSNA